MEETSAFNQVMSDAGKARIAIEEFLRENPAGASRKKIIDWAAFKRATGVQNKYTVRQGEVEMDIDDYFAERAKPRGKTRQESDKEFEELAKSGKYDREGEGAFLKLWLPRLRERMRDVVHYSDAHVEESGKQLKNFEKADKDDLLNVCLKSNASHTSAFMRQVVGGSQSNQTEEEEEKEPAAAAEALPKKQRFSSVSDQAPKQYGKLKNKDMPALTRVMTTALQKVEANEKEAETIAKGLGAQDLAADPELAAYKRTLQLRRAIASIWMCDDLRTAEIALSTIPRECFTSAPATSAAASAPAPGTPKTAGSQANDASPEALKTPEVDKSDKKDKIETEAQAKPTEVSSGSSQAGSASKPKGSKKPLGEQITEKMLGALKSAGKDGLVVQLPEKLKASLHMSELTESTLAASAMEELDERVDAFKKSAEQTRLLAASLTKAANNFLGHIKNLKKKQERDATKQKKDEENREVSRVKAVAKAAAQQVKQEEKSTPALFLVDLAQMENDSSVLKFPVHDGSVKEIPMDRPVLFKNIQAVQEWAKLPKLQLALGTFGGKYKKADSYNSEGKSQTPLYNREGKEESLECIKGFLQAVPERHRVTEENAFSKVLETPWLYGYDPALTNVSACPLGFPMFKILAQGSVKVIAMETVSLLAALRAVLQVDKISYADLPKLVGSLDGEKLKQCKSAGLKAYYTVQEAHEAVWVPAGWIVAEQSMKGVLIYGLRVSTLTRSEESSSNYETLIGLFSEAKKNVDSMQKVLELLEPL